MITLGVAEYGILKAATQDECNVYMRSVSLGKN